MFCSCRFVSPFQYSIGSTTIATTLLSGTMDCVIASDKARCSQVVAANYGTLSALVNMLLTVAVMTVRETNLTVTIRMVCVARMAQSNTISDNGG